MMLYTLLLLTFIFSAYGEEYPDDTNYWKAGTWTHVGAGTCQSGDGGRPYMFTSDTTTTLEACQAKCEEVHDQSLCYGVSFSDAGVCALYVRRPYEVAGFSKFSDLNAFEVDDSLTATDATSDNTQCYSVTFERTCTFQDSPGAKLWSMEWIFTQGWPETEWNVFMKRITQTNKASCEKACCRKSVCSTYEISEQNVCILYKDVEIGNDNDRKIFHNNYKLSYKLDPAPISTSSSTENDVAQAGSGFVGDWQLVQSEDHKNGMCKNLDGHSPTMYTGDEQMSFQECKDACAKAHAVRKCYGIQYEATPQICSMYVYWPHPPEGFTLHSKGSDSWQQDMQFEKAVPITNEPDLECYKVTFEDSCEWHAFEQAKMFSMMWVFQYGFEQAKWPFYLAEDTVSNEMECRAKCCENPNCTAYEIKVSNGKCTLFQEDLEEDSPFDRKVAAEPPQVYNLAFKLTASSGTPVGTRFSKNTSSHSLQAFIPTVTDCIAFGAGVALACLVMYMSKSRKQSSFDTYLIAAEEV